MGFVCIRVWGTSEFDGYVASEFLANTITTVKSQSLQQTHNRSEPSRRRSSSSRGSTASLGEDGYGTTFVELIKRTGSHLGVSVVRVVVIVDFEYIFLIR